MNNKWEEKLKEVLQVDDLSYNKEIIRDERNTVIAEQVNIINQLQNELVENQKVITNLYERLSATTETDVNTQTVNEDKLKDLGGCICKLIYSCHSCPVFDTKLVCGQCQKELGRWLVQQVKSVQRD